MITTSTLAIRTCDRDGSPCSDTLRLWLLVGSNYFDWVLFFSLLGVVGQHIHIDGHPGQPRAVVAMDDVKMPALQARLRECRWFDGPVSIARSSKHVRPPMIAMCAPTVFGCGDVASGAGRLHLRSLKRQAPVLSRWHIVAESNDILAGMISGMT